MPMTDAALQVAIARRADVTTFIMRESGCEAREIKLLAVPACYSYIRLSDGSTVQVVGVTHCEATEPVDDPWIELSVMRARKQE